MKDRDGFQRHDEYKSLTVLKLETLLKKAQETALSLKTELEKQKVASKLNLPTAISDCCKRLQTTATNFKILKCLDDKTAKLINTAVDILTTVQMNCNSKIYQVFLHDILRYCGQKLVLLCSASLDKQRIINMTEPDRISLVNFVKDKKASLLSSILDVLATTYELPHENSMFYTPHSYVLKLICQRHRARPSGRTAQKTHAN